MVPVKKGRQKWKVLLNRLMIILIKWWCWLMGGIIRGSAVTNTVMVVVADIRQSVALLQLLKC
uniref:Uncharacterized protein n=1 Tax=Manihot esculenta TaxID=3983 RepID=A0A2C9V2S7_MANES